MQPETLIKIDNSSKGLAEFYTGFISRSRSRSNTDQMETLEFILSIDQNPQGGVRPGFGLSCIRMA